MTFVNSSTKNYLASALAFIFVVLMLTGCPTGLEEADLDSDPSPTDTHWLRIAHISDPQIVDEESPARSVRTDALIAVSWRPQEAFGIHTLDAMLQRINAIHDIDKDMGYPVDFMLMTGDLTDGAQKNELQWFMDTLDGKTVTADSGQLHGSYRDLPPELNPKLPYDAVGLNPDIPWYTCIGNHDYLSVGNFPIDRSPTNQEDWFSPLLPPVALVLGLYDISWGLNDLIPTLDWSPAVLLDSGVPFNPDTMKLIYSELHAGPIFPDAMRQFLSQQDFVDIHFASTTPPAGHGLAAAKRLDSDAVSYSVKPVDDVPVRLITFSTVARDAFYGLPLYFGVMDRAHFENFVIPAIEEALEAEEWVILASHHPPTDFDLPYPGFVVGTQEFHDTLASYPNVIMHLAGHTHKHRAEIVPGDFPYLEIETAAIIDYPQEGRLLDVFYNQHTQQIRVESQMFSHMDNPTIYSAESFRRASIDEGFAKTNKSSDEDLTIFKGALEGPWKFEAQRRNPDPPEGREEDRNFSVNLQR